MATSKISASVFLTGFGNRFSSMSMRIKFPVFATISAPIKVSHAKNNREISYAQLMGIPMVLAIADKNTRADIAISIAPANTSSIRKTKVEICFIRLDPLLSGPN